jgi:hypothetical protein
VVVPARQAGMASGVNSTFRQVGIATGVAALGSIFSARITDSLTDLLAVGPLAARAQELALAATGGQVNQVLTGLPPEQQAIAMAAVQQSFATSLNDILLIGAALAFVSAVFAVVLIRSKDFVSEENTDTDQRVALAVA